MRVNAGGPVLFLLLCLSCGRATEAAPQVKTPSAASRGAGDIVRASWHLHPLSKGRTNASVSLDSGGVLEVDEGGSRWIKKEGDLPQAAPFGAPEPLVGVVRDEQRWAAVGRSGSVYFFDQPLGPFTATVTPPEPLVTTIVVGTTVVGVDSSGRLVRSDDLGRRFEPVAADGFFVDVGRTEQGHLYAVSVPERWFKSTDRGLHFKPIALPSVAPLSFEQSKSGELVVHGLFASVTPANSSWSSVQVPAPAKSREKLPIFARVSPIEDRTALFDQFGYLALRAGAGTTTFTSEAGPVDRELEQGSWPRPSACKNYQLFGSTRAPVLRCLNDTMEVSPPLQLYRWRSATKSWVAISTRLRASKDALRIVADEAGTLALIGACAPHRTEEGCEPYGIVRIGARDELRFDQIPLNASILDLQFGLDRKLWVLSHREKDNHLLLHGPFEPLGVPGLQVKDPRTRDLTELSQEIAVDASKSARILLEGDLITVLSRRFGRVHVAHLDTTGRFIGVTMAPAGVDAVQGSGQHLAGVDAARSLYWESASGGLMWTKQSLPARLCQDKKCSATLVCSQQACMVGDELVRTGSMGPGVAPVTSPRRRESDASSVKAADGITCSLVDSMASTPLRLWEIPSEHDVLVGESIWFGIQGDEQVASAQIVSAPLGQVKLRTTALFTPKTSTQEYVLRYFPQVEGSAVMRAPTAPGSKDLAGPIELAWNNQIEGITERVTIGPGTAGPGAELRLGEEVNVSMLSVAGRGLFFRASQGREQTPYFFPGAGQAASPFVEPVLPNLSAHNNNQTFLQQLARGARSEGVVSEGEPSGLFLLANNRVVVREMIEGGKTSYVPILMGSLSASPGSADHNVQIAYRGKNVGFLSIQHNDSGEARRGSFVELGGDGFLPAVPAALPEHLPPRPIACSREVREQTPRVVLPDLKGKNRKVQVLGVGNEPTVLEMSAAVVFGSPQEPCLGAWTADQQSREVTRESGGVLQAVISIETGAVSWLFRSEGAPGDGEVTVQPMSCSFE